MNNGYMKNSDKKNSYMKQSLLMGLATLCTALNLHAAPVQIDRVAAIVDESIIMQSELNARVESVKRQMGGQLPPDNILRPQVLERLILENIQLQMAERGGVQITDQQLTDTVKRIAQQNNMTLSEFSEALKADGLSYREAVDQIKTEMLISRVQKFQVTNKVQISQQDIDNFLASKVGKIAAEAEYRLSHILISIPSQASSSEIQAAKAKADKKRADEARIAKENLQKEALQREQLRKQAEAEKIQRQKEEAFLDDFSEETLEDYSADEAAAMSYMGAIQQAVEANWSRPPSARNGMQVTLAIQLFPTGQVNNVNIATPSGNAAFDRSAVAAVQRAERFPELAELKPRVFEKYYRSFKLVFKPEDLRL